MSMLDWTILIGFMAALAVFMYKASKLTRSVADYMVANRCAGRYVLTAASAMSALGAIQVIQEFQRSYEAGLSHVWWNQLMIPVGLAVALSGWVAYRWRATRILTQAQLFEARYSRNYRVFAGIISFIGGVAGLAIFPVAAAHFFEHFLHLPATVVLLGFEIATYKVILVSLITLATASAFIGGQIVIILSDTFQAIFTFGVVALLAGFFLWKYDWSQLMSGLAHTGVGESKLNPFETGSVKNYNATFYLIYAFNIVFIWSCGGWNQASNSSGITPHETRMAGVLARLREIVVYVPLYLAPVFVYAIMQLPDYQAVTQQVQASLVGQSVQMQRELTVPMALSVIMPMGMVGAFAAMMFAAYISTDNAYYLQFGGMFVQDVVLPFRKEAFGGNTHIWLLRGSVVMVALIVGFFGLGFEQKQDISMYFSLIWSAVGGGIYIPFFAALYWRKATTLGCWASAICGALLSIVAFGLERNGSVIGDQWTVQGGSVRWSEHTIFVRNEAHKIAAGQTTAFQVAWSQVKKSYVGVQSMDELKKTDPDAELVVENIGGKIVYAQSGFWRGLSEALAVMPGVFTQTGAVRGFFITILSALLFVVVSLLDRVLRRQPEFNLDQLLHRGKFAIAGELDEANKPLPGVINRVLNITQAFTKMDRWLYFALIAWGLLGLAAFLVGTGMWWLGKPMSNAGWSMYWRVYVYASFVVVVVGALFLIKGALRDMTRMWKTLKTGIRDASDDGRVRHDPPMGH